MVGKKDRCAVFGSNNDRLFPEKYTETLSFWPKSVNVNVNLNILLSTPLRAFQG